jgi:hypothetical protein
LKLRFKNGAYRRGDEPLCRHLSLLYLTACDGSMVAGVLERAEWRQQVKTELLERVATVREQPVPQATLEESKRLW